MRRVILFYLFSPNEQYGGWGGGGYAARLFLLFSFPCSADHERDWPPCKVVFFGLATDTLNVRNNNNNNNRQIVLLIRVHSQYVCMYGHTYSKSMDQPGKVANPPRGQLSRKNEYFPVRVLYVGD